MPYGISQATWNKLPYDDQQQIIVAWTAAQTTTGTSTITVALAPTSPSLSPAQPLATQPVAATTAPPTIAPQETVGPQNVGIPPTTISYGATPTSPVGNLPPAPSPYFLAVVSAAIGIPTFGQQGLPFMGVTDRTTITLRIDVGEADNNLQWSIKTNGLAITARDIYVLGHEIGHIQQGSVYSDPDANHRSALMFKHLASVLGASGSQVLQLWNALPSYWQNA